MSVASTANIQNESPNIAFVILIAGANALGGFLFGFDTTEIFLH